jgi:hypothetical protein
VATLHRFAATQRRTVALRGEAAISERTHAEHHAQVRNINAIFSLLRFWGFLIVFSFVSSFSLLLVEFSK